jgi:hypothetical protein
MHAIYIRRPGPKSEIPQSAQEWDDLLARCLAARRDELLARVRDLLSGAVAPPPGPPRPALLNRWVEQCLARWHTLSADLPPGDARRCPLGHHWFAYELRGDVRCLSGPELLDVLGRSAGRLTGWPTWWVPTRGAIAPYMQDGSVECWLGRDADRHFGDAAHSDFWGVSPDGFAFLLHGYQEDGPHVMGRRDIEPGGVFDVTLPVWRVGEALLHAERLVAANLGGDGLTVAFRARYEGLRGRRLVSVTGDRAVWEDRTSQQDGITLDTVVPPSGRGGAASASTPSAPRSSSTPPAPAGRCGPSSSRSRAGGRTTGHGSPPRSPPAAPTVPRC